MIYNIDHFVSIHTRILYIVVLATKNGLKQHLRAEITRIFGMVEPQPPVHGHRRSLPRRRSRGGKASPMVSFIYPVCYIYIYIPVVPARGGAEVALKIYIRLFSSIELACAVRQPSPCVRALCESGVLFHMSHLKLHFALHTSHCTLHTPHCTLHTPHFSLHTALFPIHTSHFTARFPLHTPHFTRHTPHFTLHTPHFTLHSPRPTLHTALSTLHTSSHLCSSHLIPAHLFSSHLFSYVT